jgi:hypothetical protein
MLWHPVFASRRACLEQPKHGKIFLRTAAEGAVMEDGPYLRTLACECSNKGAALYFGAGTHRRLHDWDGDFHRGGEGDDPPIICDICRRPVKT